VYPYPRARVTVRPTDRRDARALRPPASLLDTGSGRFRVGPHRGDAGLAQLGPLPGTPLAAPEGVRRAVVQLQRDGWRRAVTPALSPVEQEAFYANGFTVREHLHLLERPVRLADARLRELPDGVRLGRATADQRPAILAVDQLAFDEFWRLDERGLLDAVAATPSARVRVARADDRIVGYHVTGRAGRRGYLQRLAVDPQLRRLGVATALIADGARWLARSGARAMVVNTQEGNAGALALYQARGFVLQPGGLAVLERDLTVAAATPPSTARP
jgi:ribosomal protein S18 acetylase RimI-like enzyme